MELSEPIAISPGFRRLRLPIPGARGGLVNALEAPVHFASSIIGPTQEASERGDCIGILLDVFGAARPWSRSASSTEEGAMRNLSSRIPQGSLNIKSSNSESIVRSIFESVGIEVGGRLSHDIQVRDPRFYRRVIRDGSLGFGESYVDGWWDSDALDDTLVLLGRADVNTVMRQNWHMIPMALKARLFNMQRGNNAFDVAERHYNLGNGLYSAMLDERMVYTCGYWRECEDLESAQEAKLDLVCRKIGLREGMSVLDLGCGWGSFAKFAAERYGAKVTGVTISKEQMELGRERCAGLPVEIRLQDYRDVSGTYDAVISIGIMEHVGAKNYRTYVKVVDSCLADDGVAFVHTIGGNRSRREIEPWIHRYIFPNAVLPSIAQLGAALEGIFVLEDVHNFGPDYDRTLMAWDENFRAAWPELEATYDDRFYRMWRYYLCMSAAGFRSRQLQLYQLVLTRTGTPQRDFRLS